MIKTSVKTGPSGRDYTCSDFLQSDPLPTLNYSFNIIELSEGNSPIKSNSQFSLKMLKILFLTFISQCSLMEAIVFFCVCTLFLLIFKN